MDIIDPDFLDSLGHVIDVGVGAWDKITGGALSKEAPAESFLLTLRYWRDSRYP